MNGNQERISELRGLLIDIQVDITGLNRLYDAMVPERVASITDADDELLVWGLAAWLHHLYTGVESLMTRVAQVLDGYTPRGEDWHRRLLTSMSIPLEDVRPAVLSSSTFAYLDELRRFRHLFRYAYGAEMDRTRVKALALEALAMRPALTQDLKRLEDFAKGIVAHHES